MPFGCFTQIKEWFVVGTTWLVVFVFFLCGIWSANSEWSAFAVVVLIVCGHNSLRNDEAIALAKRGEAIEAKLDEALAEIAKLKGGQ